MDYEEIDDEKPNGFISRRDIIRELTEKAEAGDKDAQFELALQYYNIYNQPKHGDDVDFDILDCIDWMTKSAEQGDIRSQRELGKLCSENNLGYHDYGKAYLWLKKAAKAGDQGAKIWLAKYYRNEETFYSKPKKAVKILKSAINESLIDEDYNEAVYELGMCYLTGYGVRRAQEKAHYWFKIGTFGGHAKSCLNLGVCYMLGQGTDKNPAAAYDYISEARDLAENERKNLPEAEYLLGICYYYGIGVEKDYKKAFQQFSKISKSWPSAYSTHATYMIGELYYHGRGMRKNREKAFNHYSAVANTEPENEKAAYALGRCYANGHGVEKNRDKAIYWYTRAEVAGSYKAEEAVYLLIEGKEKPKYSATLEYSSRYCGVVTGHRKLTPEEKERARESSRELKEHFGIL